MALSNVANKYYYGKGKVSLVERSPDGSLSRALYTGNCPDLKVTLNSESLQHFESTSGTNQQDREIIKTIGAEVSITLESLSPDNAGVLVWGQKQTMASAPGQTFEFPLGIVSGERYIIPNGFNLTNVVISDDAATPVPLVLGTDYNIDADFGTVEFLDVSGLTQPFSAAYTRGAGVNVPFFGTSRPNRFLRFEGINLGNPGAAQTKVLVEVYNIVFNPVADISLIGDDFGKFELKGSALVDDSRTPDSAFGSFGRMIYI